MKLRSVLSLQPIDSLRRIASATDLSPDPGGNKTALVDLLCRSLADPAQVRARLDLLGNEERAFVAGLAAEGGELLRQDAVEELCSGFPRRFQALLKAAVRVGLVFEDAETLGADHPLIGIPDPLLKSIPLPEADRGRLRSAMRSPSIGILRAFARDLGIPLKDARRPFVVRAIRAHLLHPDRLRACINGLSEEKRAVLDLILKAGETTQKEVRGRLGEGAARELDDLLWKTPLLFCNGERVLQGTPIRLATDLREALRALAEGRGGRLQSQPEEMLETASGPPSETRSNATYLLQDLATLLGFVERRRPRMLKRGGVAKAELRDVRRFYRGDDDPGYPDFLVLFAETAGLIRAEGRAWRLAGGAAGRLEEGAEIQKALLAFWQETERWNEWTAERAAAAGRRARMEELKTLRREVLDGLRRCPPGRWVSYPGFYRLLERTSGPFRHLTEHPGSGRSLAAGGTTADELLRRMLRGALAWVGLVELGNPPAFDLPLHREGNALFRITPAGRTLLDGEAPDVSGLPQTSPEARFILQPNLEALSPPDLPYGRYIELCGLAELRAIDVMARFRIGPDTLQGAMNRGTSGGSIRKFLKTCSATGLPDIVEALIRECERKHGEIEIVAAPGYLTVEQDGLLDELYAQKRIARHLGPRLAPTVAALGASAKPAALLELLRKGGYMPRLVQDAGAGQDGHHQVVLRSSELSQLVGFLETALKTLNDRSVRPPEDIDHLLQRLRRGLRDIPDRERQEALSRYGEAFKALFKGPPADEGLQALIHYPGANPAACPEEVRSLIDYAIDHRLCIEIDYGDGPAGRLIEPLSGDHAFLYAFCRARKGDRVFRLDKIRAARLTGERLPQARS